NVSDGMVTAMGSGSGTFNYYWLNTAGDTVKTTENTSSADTLSGLEDGLYTVIVSGNDQCGIVKSKVELVSPLASASNSIIKNNVRCYGGADGNVTISFTGGNDNKTFQWENGSTDSMLTNISAGEYAVTISEN